MVARSPRLKNRPGSTPATRARAAWHEAADRRIGRVLWNDPATGVMRHADAGYDIAIECAREHGLNLPMVDIGGAS